MPARNGATMNKTNRSQVATDFDRLIVDIAACDDLEVIEYYARMARYLTGLAEYRKITIESAGFGVFFGDRFMKRFVTKDQAHEYIIAKIIAIHECDEGEIVWQDYDDIGYCRSYWIGEKGFMHSSRDSLALIWSVDEDDERLHTIRVYDAPPQTPDGLNYQSSDEATQKLSSLIKENNSLKSELKSSRQKNAEAWDEVNTVKLLAKGKDARKRLDEWLKENKDLLQHELIKGQNTDAR